MLSCSTWAVYVPLASAELGGTENLPPESDALIDWTRLSPPLQCPTLPEQTRIVTCDCSPKSVPALPLNVGWWLVSVAFLAGLVRVTCGAETVAVIVNLTTA